MQKLRLAAAYGRVYRTMGQAVNAWNAGKDFQMMVQREGHTNWEIGPYTSIRDYTVLSRDFVSIELCYNPFYGSLATKEINHA